MSNFRYGPVGGPGGGVFDSGSLNSFNARINKIDLYYGRSGTPSIESCVHGIQLTWETGAYSPLYGCAVSGRQNQSQHAAIEIPSGYYLYKISGIVDSLPSVNEYSFRLFNMSFSWVSGADLSQTGNSGEFGSNYNKQPINFSLEATPGNQITNIFGTYGWDLDQIGVYGISIP